ncbi:hypothetical protein IOD13_00070 [Brevibacterium casei]|nr:hypothetical protein [Brevibacterium casei]
MPAHTAEAYFDVTPNDLTRGRCAPRSTRRQTPRASSPPCRRASSTTSSKIGRSIGEGSAVPS